MKKIIYILPALLLTILIACNNNAEDNPPKKTNSQTVAADSLEKAVMEGHDVGMSKMGKLSKMKNEAQRLIDSIDHLPAKAQEAAASVKKNLQSVANDLDNAIAAMNSWMEGFNYDSARENVEQRIKYLTDEKLKVDNVKENILSSLQKADSLLKSKF